MFLGVCAYIGFKRTPDFVKAPVLAVVTSPLSLLKGRAPAPQRPGGDPTLAQRERWEEQQRQRQREWEQREQQQGREREQRRQQEQEQEQQMRRRMDASGEVWELDEEARQQQQQQHHHHEQQPEAGGAQHLGGEFVGMGAVSSEELQEQLAGSMRADMGGAEAQHWEQQQQQQQQEEAPAVQQPPAEQPPAEAQPGAAEPSGAWHGDRMVPQEMGEWHWAGPPWRSCLPVALGSPMPGAGPAWLHPRRG